MDGSSTRQFHTYSVGKRKTKVDEGETTLPVSRTLAPSGNIYPSVLLKMKVSCAALALLAASYHGVGAFAPAGKSMVSSALKMVS